MKLQFTIIFTLFMAGEILTMKENIVEQNFNIKGAVKVTTNQQYQTQKSNVTEQSKTTAYTQKNFRVEKGNNVALTLEKNMGTDQISQFIQQKLQANPVDEATLQKMKLFEQKLDMAIEQYISTNPHHTVKKEGNVVIEKQVLFVKNGKNIFYDPKFMSLVWQKTEFMIQRNELSTEAQAFELLDEEFLKDDMLDLVQVIQKSTWFVFKHSALMPFWIETIRIMTDAEFLSGCTKEELVYIHYYVKKLFKIFSKALLGTKIKSNSIEYILIFSAIIPKIEEYQAAAGFLLQHIDVEGKRETEIYDDAKALVNNQNRILETLDQLKEKNYLETIDPALKDEMAVIKATMDKMNQGISLSTGDIHITTIIKTKVIDIQKRLLKKIRLILSGEMIAKFAETSIYSQLAGVLSALEDLLNSHMLDNDPEVEIILESLELFLIKLEAYLVALKSETDRFVVEEGVHSDLISALTFFVSKVRNVSSIKTSLLKKQYAFFLTRVELLLLALEQPASDQRVEVEFDKIPFVPDYNVDNTLEDLFNNFDTLPNDKEPEYDNIRKGAEKTMYWIKHNIDNQLPEVNPQVKKALTSFIAHLRVFVNNGSMLSPFYSRVLETYLMVENDMNRLGDFTFVKKLQDLYLLIASLQQEEKNQQHVESNEDLDLGKNNKLVNIVQYSYRLYREKIRPLLAEVLVHLKYVCSNCSEEAINAVSNENSSYKGSVLDAVQPEKRIRLDPKPGSKPSKYRIYVVEDLDCDVATVYLRYFIKDSEGQYRVLL